MLFGHNTNLTVGGATFHVQTEDRGVSHALIDTTVFCRGRVLHRRTNNYFDLLPLNPDREEALKIRLDEQHRAVLDDIRSGVLNLAPPPPAPDVLAVAPQPSSPPPQEVLALELTNAKSWLKGKQANLQILVRDDAGDAASGARIVARIEGASEPVEYSTQTGFQGQATLEFEMPRLSGPEAALVIEAAFGEARGLLRFQMRAKPRVPSAS